MRSVEVEGGSIDEAIERALAALGVAREQVQIDILENASRGWLRLGRRRARVRATLRAPLTTWDAAMEGGSAEPHGTAGPPARSAAIATADAVATFDGAAFVGSTLRLMGFDGSVTARGDGDGRARLELASGDGGVAACRDDVLRALEHVVNRVAERHGVEGTRFTVTAAGSADRSRSERRPTAGPRDVRRARGDLRALARRLAERARAHGKAVTMPALGNAERSIVLEALRAETGIAVRIVRGAHGKFVIIPGERRRGGGARER